MTTLTDSQRAVILLAVETGGPIVNFPEYLKGGARTAVMRGLLHADLIAADGGGHRLTEAGWLSVGYEWRPPISAEAGDGDDGDVGDGTDSEPAGACSTVPATDAAPAGRTKPLRLDLVLALLSRPSGATISQVMEATNWQAHSVRGFFAGTIRKKGYALTSSKEGKEERVYRIQTDTPPSGDSGNAAD